MFITALFTIAKIWMQPKYLSTNKWIKKMCCVYVYVCVCVVVVLIVQSCLTLLRPHRLYSPPGFSVHGISQARILSGLPFSSPGDLLNPRIEPMSPALVGGFFTTESIYMCMYVCTFGEGNGTPLKYSCLENSMDGGAC